MSTLTFTRLAALALMAWLGPAAASAQVFGTFPWQMQPYCNVVRLTLTTTPAGFALDGVDDQCGAVNKASAVGVASFNGGGNVTLNFSIVAAPSGKPVHVSAVVSPANGQGTWTDSVGNNGTFAFFGAVPGLPARPMPVSGLAPSVITTVEIAAGAVGVSDINTAEVQARVSGSCAPGQSLAGVNANGTVVCGYGGHVASAYVTTGAVFGYSRGFSAVTRPSTGVYCLTPTLPAGLTLADVYSQVSVEWIGSIGNDLFAHAVNNSTFGCAAGEVPVRTYRMTGNPVTGVAESNQVGFFISLFRR